MSFCRRSSLSPFAVYLCAVGLVPVWAQTPADPAPATPGQTKPAPAPSPKPANPFESIPEAPAQQAPKPAEPKPQFETPKPAEPGKPVAAEGQVIEVIEFRGARRVPQDTLRALIYTKRGDLYNEEALRRDFMALWNTGRFDDIRLETEPGREGLIVRFVLTERRVVRSIKYEGMKSITVSEILDRFKERKVGLSVESQYDPNKVQRAAVVLKEYLSERGRQYAEVEPDVRQIPPSSLEITFNVKEGPKVKVGEIEITGNNVMGDRAVIRAMKNLRPIGIPYSIFLEGIFSKTFDSTKLEEDADRIRDAYQQQGYFTARVLDHSVTVRDTGGKGFRLPLFKPNRRGKRADIVLPIEEGRQYHLNHINFVGVKLFRTPETLMRPLFQMGEGDIFSTAKLRKGLENLRKLYGEFGYIDFVPEPSFEPIPNSDKIDLTLTADEGKQFFVRRIDFSGNTTTRDKVIRRELLLDEGDMFNTRLWELSVLRLNQLGYFEQLKENEAADLKRNTQTNTVDITLKVKERGKNSIGMNGGVSGIAGSFMGFNYSTNNFLGLGETLSIDSQLGTRLRSVQFAFTEPYFLDRPIQLGFEVHTTRFNYDQGREVSILAGRDYQELFNQMGRDYLMNYVQNGVGFSVSSSYQLRRTFARVGVSVGYDRSNIAVDNTYTKNYFQYMNFQGLAGPNSLTGIRTAYITPSYSYNTVNHPITPTGGRSLFISTQFSGGFLGGNVNTIRPVIDAKYFRPSPWKKSHILAFHAMASLLSGYGGKVAPPFSRTYIGGEQDIRGFDIWGITPVVFIPSETSVQVYNDDGSARTQKGLVDGVLKDVGVTQRVPIYQAIYPGGDTQIVGNFEYRIPIVGPVNLAFFTDVGLNKILLTNQLKMDVSRTSELNDLFPQAGFDGRPRIGPGTQKPRMSTGIELQVMLPVVNAPFRIYWAYNPLIVREYVQPPIVADRSYYPNQTTFVNAINTFGSAIPWYEKRSTFRFTIGRTF
ncbi:MAG TPA: outer membrane protein assembly factor BamA [Bryobacteraceae bacterium]|nr:outer membrane protein assembly factor BamA [Bryobacteraceae bacterium]